MTDPRPTKVLILGWEFPPHISGGLGTACEGLATALAAQGVELTFVVPHLSGDEHPDQPITLVAPPDLDPEDEPAPVELEIRRVEAMLTPYMRPDHYLALHESEPRTPHYGRDLFAEVSRYATRTAALVEEARRCDVIHAHDWMTFPAARMLQRLTGTPLVVHVHSLEFDRSGEHPDPRIDAIEREGTLSADRVIAVSHYTRKIIEREHGTDPDRLRVVHNGVARKERLRAYHASHPHRHDKTVLFLGRVTHQKGPDYFIDAAAKVLERSDGIKFVIAGSGDMLPRLIERVAELGLSRHFHFTGFLKGEQLELMFSIADLYVMPSVSEPFGIAPLEALVRDTPVIISKQSGVSEVLRHALRADFWDTDRLASLILAALSYPAIGRTMTELGTDELLSLRWESSATKVRAVYDELRPAAE